MIAAALFWICFAFCLYIYFGYPALLWIVSRLRPRPVDQGDITPSMTVIVPAFNEEPRIARKISNTLSLDYPSTALEVLVASNGSTDATNRIVREWGDPRVRLLELELPGKMDALNRAARQATGEILVFTDADFLLDAHSLREIARKFHDPEVGGVCGARRDGPRDGDSTSGGEGMYGRWDRWQKVRESRIGSVFAADGLLYAIRRELYVPVVDPAQADDIAISVQIPLQGFRLLFEPRASAWEEAVIHAGEEFRRKIRVTNHSVRALLNLRGRLFTSGFYSVELLSHKLLRHFVPLFLIPMLGANALLALRSPLYASLFAGHALLYLLGGAGALLRNSPAGRRRVFYIPYYFFFVNAAALLGVLSILRGRRLAAWTRPADEEDAARGEQLKAECRMQKGELRIEK